MEKHFKTQNVVILWTTSLDEYYSEACGSILRETEEFEALKQEVHSRFQRELKVWNLELTDMYL